MDKKLHQILKLFFSSTSLLLFTHFHTSAQTTFHKTFATASDNYGTDVKQTADSGYIFGGYSLLQDEDFFLIKTDKLGDTLWTRRFGDPPGSPKLRSVIQAADGGFVVTGNNFDAFVMKTDLNGLIEWTTYFGLASGIGFEIIQTHDGSFVVTGYYADQTTQDDIFISKIDSIGNIVWLKTYGTGEDDWATCIKETSDKGYIITGISGNIFGTQDMFLVKTDSLGDIKWKKKYGQNTDNDGGYSLVQADDGGYVVVGTSYSFLSGGVYVVKTDSAGIHVWSRVYNGAHFLFSTIDKTSDGGYFITAEEGNITFCPYLIKIDTAGNLIWYQQITSATAAMGRTGWGHQTFDGGYIVVGTKDNPTADMDVVLIKTDSLGMSRCSQISGSFNNPPVPATQTYSFNLNIQTPSINVFPFTFTTGSGMGYANTCSSPGIQSYPNNHEMFNIYPNPGTGDFKIQFQKTIAKGTIQITDLTGAFIFTETVMNESEKEFNLNQVSPGIYFVKIMDEESSYCGKVIVERD